MRTAGARGLLARTNDGAQIAAAVQAVVHGLLVFDDALRPAAAPSADVELVEPLSGRELDVLRHLAEGLSNKEIARALDISEHTVKFHVNAILGKMQAAMGEAKSDVSQFAPKLYTMKINPEKIRDVIGKGGATIRMLTEETGTTIDIGEDGTITIASTDADKAQHAIKRITEITAEAEVGKVYEGPVTKLLDFGALVNILPGKDGLLHISQIAHERVEKVTDYLSEGQVVRVKVLETDEKGRVKLSMKALLERQPQQAAPQN